MSEAVDSGAWDGAAGAHLSFCDASSLGERRDDPEGLGSLSPLCGTCRCHSRCTGLISAHWVFQAIEWVLEPQGTDREEGTRCFRALQRSAEEDMAQSPASEAVSEYLPNAAGGYQVNGVLAPRGCQGPRPHH